MSIAKPISHFAYAPYDRSKSFNGFLNRLSLDNNSEGIKRPIE